MASIFEDIHGTPLNDVTVAQYAEQWLVRITPEVDPSTLERYGDAFKSARRADASIFSKRIDNVTTADLAALRTALLKNHSFGTARMYLKPISRMFKTAFHDGLTKDDPAARLGRIKKPTGEGAAQSKQPFTIPQIKAVLGLASDEWRGMILAGYYSAGQRLGDIAALTPGMIDLREQVVSFKTGKTGRTVNLPILPGWTADLKARTKGKKADEPLFPKAASMVDAKGKVSRLSNAFRTLLSKAGLATPPGHGKAKVAGRRTASALSFHSFRYTATSVMKNAGVSDSVVMDIVGHESEAVSENYTKVSHQAKREALKTLPDIA